MNNASPQSKTATDDQPIISVVIACVNGPSYLIECIKSLLDQKTDHPYEIILINRCGEQTRAELNRNFPKGKVRLIEAESTDSIPRLRAIGIAEARGQMIAILADHCSAYPGWIDALFRHHNLGHEAVGGAVENGATQRLTDWAVYFCEYAQFMAPIPEGPVDKITGNNSAYSSRLLERLKDDADFAVSGYISKEGKLKIITVRFYFIQKKVHLSDV